MPPVPCKHCGINFMRHSSQDENFELCNNCKTLNSIKNPKKGHQMDQLEILIKVPTDVYKLVELNCSTRGISFSEYFLELLQPQEPIKFEKKLTKKEKQ